MGPVRQFEATNERATRTIGRNADVSGHTKWSEMRASRGVTGKWVAVAGDDRVKHYFTDTVRPHWRQAAKCGKGPAVGDSPSDARLGFCTDCLPVEPEDLEDVDGIHG